MANRLAERLSYFNPKLTHFSWSNHDQERLQVLLKDLQEQMVRYIPDWNKPMVIYCDGSLEGVGGFLAQEDAKGMLCPIMFFSKALSPVMSRWAVYEIEAYAILFALSKCRMYLIKPFTIRTDHKPLVWMTQSVRENSASHKVYRWILSIMDFPKFSVIHIEGKSNVGADSLSRSPFVKPSTEVFLNFAEEAFSVAETPVEVPLAPTHNDFKGDAFFEIALCLLNKTQLPDVLREPIYEPVRRLVQQHLSRLSIEGGRLMYKADEKTSRDNYGKLFYVKTDKVEEVLSKAHDAPYAGHFGVKKTLARLSQCWWPHMREDVEWKIKTCGQCLRNKVSHALDAELFVPDPTHVWQQLHLDLIGPLPKTIRGHQYILNVIDSASKYDSCTAH